MLAIQKCEQMRAKQTEENMFNKMYIDKSVDRIKFNGFSRENI